jgi:hypothetical protein
MMVCVGDNHNCSPADCSETCSRETLLVSPPKVPFVVPNEPIPIMGYRIRWVTINNIAPLRFVEHEFEILVCDLGAPQGLTRLEEKVTFPEQAWRAFATSIRHVKLAIAIKTVDPSKGGSV